MTAAPLPRARVRATAPRRQALTFAVALVAVAGLLAALVELALFYSGPAAPRPPWVAALFPLYALVYVLVGAFAWLRRPGSLVGPLLAAGGFVWIVSGLQNTAVPALQAAGLATATVPIALVMHLLMAFPSGRLRSGAERAIVVAGYLVCLVLQVPLYVFAAGGPLQIASRPDLVTAGAWVQRGAGASVVLVICAVLVRRIRAAAPLQRRVLAPLSVYGILAILAIPVGAALADLVFGRGLALPFAQLTIMAGVPVVFAVGVLLGRFARTADIEELGAWLGAGDAGGRPELATALASALGDESVELLYRVPGEAGWVNGDGVGVTAPEPTSHRSIVEVERAGSTIGAIVYDALLLTRPGEVREAAGVVALALDRERLTVELRASRARLVEAGDIERRRIARDLHDGLQSRLVLLAVRAGLAGGEAAELRAGIETAIEELRALVDGVMPAELTERGLPAAVDALAGRMPVPVRLDLGDIRERLPPAVESTGYFVVAEALLNAVKHAQPSRLAVALARLPGDRLRIEVSDDGRGGVDAAANGAGGGHGMRSMADRVEALAGRMSIASAPGAGTRLTVELPCGS
jgi:signal transduction histidine kinase